MVYALNVYPQICYPLCVKNQKKGILTTLSLKMKTKYGSNALQNVKLAVKIVILVFFVQKDFTEKIYHLAYVKQDFMITLVL